MPTVPTHFEREARRIAMSEFEFYISSLKPMLSPLLLGFSLATWLVRGALRPTLMVAWVVLYLGFFGIRLIALRRYSRLSEESRLHELHEWIARFANLNIASGIMWGAFAWFTIPELPLFYKLVVTWIVTITGAIAAVSISTTTINLRLYLIVMLCPAALAWVKSDDTNGWMMVVAILILMFTYDRLGKRNASNIRDRLRFARELARANIKLEESNVSKTRLLVEASHDLRQPVHALGMMLSRMDPAIPAAEMGKRLKQVQTCVDSVADMLIDLLDISRLESGEYEIRRQAIELWPLLRELEQIFAPQAQRKGLGFSVTAAPFWVASDPLMLKRILGNLMSNAVKYTATGHITVTCHVGDEAIEVEVADTGVGIRADKLESIFVEYVRLDNAGDQTGYGVGLSVVKRMVDLLEHRLILKSAVGKGSSFKVLLPHAAAPESIPAETQAPQPALPLAGKLVLFIENDETLRVSTSEVLVASGAYVIDCSSISEALFHPLLFVEKPDIIISDMHLGIELEGLGTIAVLRREFPSRHIPAILLTGDLKPDLAAQAREMGVQIAYKPLRASRLPLIVATAIARAGIPELPGPDAPPARPPGRASLASGDSPGTSSVETHAEVSTGPSEFDPTIPWPAPQAGLTEAPPNDLDKPATDPSPMP